MWLSSCRTNFQTRPSSSNWCVSFYSNFIPVLIIHISIRESIAQCLIKYHAMKTCGDGILAPLILNMGANVMLVVSFIPDCFISWTKEIPPVANEEFSLQCVRMSRHRTRSTYVIVSFLHSVNSNITAVDSRVRPLNIRFLQF